MEISNSSVAEALRAIAAAYTLKKANLFQIRAYENAAVVIEHSTSEVKDLWEEGNLNQLPGVGESIQAHLEELFKTGIVKHWEEVKKGIPPAVFELLDVPGIGPKTALELAQLGVEDMEDLETKLQSGFLFRRGFSEKIGQKLLTSLQRVPKYHENRMLLPYAFIQAEKITNYLKASIDVTQVDVLGSLRRMVATVGDLDFAIASEEPEKVVNYIVKMPGINQIVDQGKTKVTFINSLGLRLDFLIVNPKTYGALLQHFTGSKSHNIHLRKIAEKQGLSLSEHGIKDIKTGHLKEIKTEDDFYHILGMETPVPEMREDTGEIEAAKEHTLPNVIDLKDIKGDLHLHDNFPIEPSHDMGTSNIKEITDMAKKLEYEYVGISDHSPAVAGHSEKDIITIIKKYSRLIEQFNYSNRGIRVLKLLEVDIQPDGQLSVPDEGLKLLDFVIASIHSNHQIPKAEMTKRILKALENPYMKVLGHPTGRLINKRESIEADWESIFKYAAANNKALEINSYPDRLDLPDNLVRIAKSFGVKFVIDTDSHQAYDMTNMRFGVAVARRGWLTKDDVVNAWDYDRFAKWFRLS